MSERRHRSDRRRTPPGLSDALRVVQALPRISYPEDSLAESEPFARGYNAGLWDARAAIMREMAEGHVPDWLVQAVEAQAKEAE
jgi:predicted metal-dependent peptidase